MRMYLLCVLILLCGLPLTVAAQPPPPAPPVLNPAPTMAAVTDDDLVIYDADGTTINVTNGVFRFIGDMAWSADGQTLAFTAPNPDDGFIREVYITNAQGSPPQLLASGIRVQNVEFLPDGRVAYIRLIEDFPDEDRFVADDREFVSQLLLPYGVYASDPADPSSEPELITTFLYAEGCGGGGRFPVAVRFWTDMSTYIQATLFRLMDDGSVLHSINCPIERRNLGRTGATVDDYTRLINGTREVISPDARYVFSVDGEGRARVVDLEVDSVIDVPLPEGAAAQNAAWGPDNTLYISAREVTNTIDYTRGGTVDFPFNWPDIAPAAAMPDYRALVYQYDLETGAVEQLLAQRGWGFGQMAVHDGMLYANLHPRVTFWADAVLRGEVNSDNLYTAVPGQVTMMGFDLQTRSASIVGVNRMRFVIQPG